MQKCNSWRRWRSDELRADHGKSGGVWALHDLVKYCLQEIKSPAEIVGYSWSLTIPAEEKLIHFHRTGQLKTEADVRKSIKEQAKQGASGAQKEFFNLVQARQQREQMNSRK